MKTIIAGSRHITDYDTVWQAFLDSGFFHETEEIVSGCAKGVDTIALRIAADMKLSEKRFPITKQDWENIHAPGARIITRPDGSQYNANAGHDRNQRMADYADALIAIWDGKSPGTRDMIARAKKKGLRVSIIIVPSA